MFQVGRNPIFSGGPCDVAKMSFCMFSITFSKILGGPATGALQSIPQLWGPLLRTPSCALCMRLCTAFYVRSCHLHVKKLFETDGWKNLSEKVQIDNRDGSSRSENLKGASRNLQKSAPPVEKGLTDLPKTGGGGVNSPTPRFHHPCHNAKDCCWEK